MNVYTVPQMAKRRGVSRNMLYKEIKAGRLHAKLRRGSTRPYLLTDEMFDEWFEHGLVDAYEIQGDQLDQ